MKVEILVKIYLRGVLHKDPVELLKQLVFFRGRLKAFHNSDPYGVEGIVDLLDHMKAVDAYLRTREVDFSDVLVELEHVHADVFDLVTLFLADP
jgi:hypothetical protein